MMKQLIQFICPTIEAMVKVFIFIAGLGWGAYASLDGYFTAWCEGQAP